MAEPTNPELSALARVYQRKPTPWTNPCTKAVTRTIVVAHRRPLSFHDPVDLEVLVGEVEPGGAFRRGDLAVVGDPQVLGLHLDVE